MRTLLHLALVCVFLTQTPAANAGRPAPRVPAEVVRVIDGDTADFRAYPWPGIVIDARVRILEIDTPERGWRAACEREGQLAEEALLLAEALLSDGVLLHVRGHDSFGRLLAHIELSDGRDYAQVMLEHGLALPYAERSRGWC